MGENHQNDQNDNLESWAIHTRFRTKRLQSIHWFFHKIKDHLNLPDMNQKEPKRTFNIKQFHVGVSLWR